MSPEWFENERGYWAARDSLLGEYAGQWVAFAGGRVVAAGRLPVFVGHDARALGVVPFMTLCGAEETPYRIRGATFGYDAAYGPHPLPVLSAEFRSAPGAPGLVLDNVIPDTGADSTVVAWADCQRIGLTMPQGKPAYIRGVTGGVAMTLQFDVWVVLDALNQLDILFRGPAGEVVVNPP